MPRRTRLKGLRATGLHLAGAASALELIGGTPLVQLTALPASAGRIVGKLEGFNPGGSMKDRTAHRMLQAALRSGALPPGGHVVESTSGNLGVGLAQAAAVLGLRLTCVVDSRCAALNIATMQAFGAKVVQVTADDARAYGGDLLSARRATVAELLRRHPAAYSVNQYANPENPAAHAEGTFAEFDAQTEGQLDTLYVPVSTTGALGGALRALRERRRTTVIVAVDAAGSVLFGGQRAPRHLPGLGAGVEPELARGLAPDRVVQVDEAAAVRWCRKVARSEGLLLGASSGAVLAAAAAGEPRTPGGLVGVLLPDRGAAYLDTVFDDDWVTEHYGPEAAQWP